MNITPLNSYSYVRNVNQKAPKTVSQNPVSFNNHASAVSFTGDHKVRRFIASILAALSITSAAATTAKAQDITDIPTPYGVVDVEVPTPTSAVEAKDPSSYVHVYEQEVVEPKYSQEYINEYINNLLPKANDVEERDDLVIVELKYEANARVLNREADKIIQNANAYFEEADGYEKLAKESEVGSDSYRQNMEDAIDARRDGNDELTLANALQIRAMGFTQKADAIRSRFDGKPTIPPVAPIYIDTKEDFLGWDDTMAQYSLELLDGQPDIENADKALIYKNEVTKLQSRALLADMQARELENSSRDPYAIASARKTAERSRTMVRNFEQMIYNIEAELPWIDSSVHLFLCMPTIPEAPINWQEKINEYTQDLLKDYPKDLSEDEKAIIIREEAERIRDEVFSKMDDYVAAAKDAVEAHFAQSSDRAQKATSITMALLDAKDKLGFADRLESEAISRFTSENELVIGDKVQQTPQEGGLILPPPTNVEEEEKDNTGATDATLPLTPPPTMPKPPVPSIVYPIFDTVEDIMGWDKTMAAYVEDLFAGQDLTADEKKLLLVAEAAKLQVEALDLQNQADTAKAEAEAAWQAFYSDGIGDKKEVEQKVYNAAALQKSADRKTTMGSLLMKIAEGTYNPVINPVPPVPTAPKPPVPSIVYPCIDTVEDLTGWDKTMSEYADKLLDGQIGLTQEEKAAIYLAEAERLQAEALELQDKADTAKAEAEAAWNAYYADGEGDKKEVDRKVMNAAFAQKAVEQKETMARLLTKMAEGTYNPVFNPAPPTIPEPPKA